MRLLKYLLLLAGIISIIVGTTLIKTVFGSVAGQVARSVPLISLVFLVVGIVLVCSGIGFWVWQERQKKQRNEEVHTNQDE